MIEYSTNNGSSWNTAAASTPNTGSYNWVIPAVDSDNCLVRVSDTAGPASDTSDAVFSIWQQPSITVTSPNGGETWTTGTTQTITWTSTGSVGSVEIRYSKNNGKSWKMVVDSTPNTGSYLWTLPVENSSKCLVKITALNGSAVDTSDAVFTILSR